MDRPAVSVVMPLFNKVDHVRRALDSVGAQTLRDFEVVVVNDGSTDGSEKIVENCPDPRIRLITQANAGASAARNRGINEAKAELVAFLDADDEYRPDFLRSIWRLRQNYPDCGLYCTSYDIITPNGRRIAAPVRGLPKPAGEGIVPNYFLSARSCIVSASSVAVPKAVFRAVGCFSESEPIAEDVNMWCRIALVYSVAFSPYVGAIYHKEATNRTHHHHPVWLSHPLVQTIENALASGELAAGVSRSDLMEYRNMALLDIAENNIVVGEVIAARRYLAEASGTSDYRMRRSRLLLYSRVPVLLRAVRSGRAVLSQMKSAITGRRPQLRAEKQAEQRIRG